MGKTTLAVNIAENAAIGAQVPTAIYSMEMPSEQLALVRVQPEGAAWAAAVLATMPLVLAIAQPVLALAGNGIALFVANLRLIVMIEETGPMLMSWLIASVATLIVALVVGGVYLQRGRVRQVAELRQAMSQNLVSAQEAGDDDDTARQYYNQIVALAAEAD